MLSAVSEGVAGQAIMAVVPTPTPIATLAVAVNPSAAVVGQTARATATLQDSTGAPITGDTVAWESSNLSVATVNPTGDVKAVGLGNTMIKGSSRGKSAAAAFSVNSAAPVPVASVSVSPAGATIQVGATTQLSAVTRDASNNVLSGRAISWSSSNTGISTVSASGLVTAVAAGPATITATSEGRIGSATVTVTAVLASVASVTITPATATVSIGQTQTLNVTLRDAAGTVLSGRSIAWTTNSPGIATVTASGLVRGIAAGPATITATSETVSGTASITVAVVTPPPPGGPGPEPGAGDVIVFQDGFDRASITEQLTGYSYAPGDYARITDGHSGDAVRVSYNAGNWNNVFGTFISAQTDAYYRYWYRTSPGADPTCSNRNQSGFKWFMTQRNDPYPRYTHGVGRLPGGPAGNQNTGMEFSTHDNSSTAMPNPFMSNINKTKRFDTTNDGQWHEYTIHVVVGTGGYEQIWIDGVKVLDSQGYGYDHSSQPIILFGFPGNMVAWFSGCEFTIDIDDLAIWHN